MRIEGSVALVTGANRGLGRAVVDALLAAGAAKVYAGARDAATVQVDDERVVALELDVTDTDEVRAAAAAAPDVDLLVNNAGVAEGVSVLDDDAEEAFGRQVDVNVLGPVRLTRAFAPVLAAHGGGAVVNVLSVLSWITSPQASTYAASKAAAWSVTNALRAQLADQGTRVVGVHVAYMDTDMAAHVEGPKTSPADLAEQIVEAVTTGQDEVLGDDVTRHAKKLLGKDPAALAV